MGLHSAEPITWLKIKDGKFYLTSDKELKTPYNSLSGVITSLKFGNVTFNGSTFEKLDVRVKSGDSLYSFSLSVDSSNFNSFMNFLNACDVSKEVTIVPKMQVDGDKKRTSVLVGQDGSYKASFTKANPGNLPPLKEVMFKGKKVFDNSEQLAFWKNLVATKYSNLSSKQEQDDAPSESSPQAQTQGAPAASTVEDDDLPF